MKAESHGLAPTVGAVALFLPLFYRADGVVRAPTRVKAIRAFAELKVKDRLKHLSDGLLDEAVEHRSDAQCIAMGED